MAVEEDQVLRLRTFLEAVELAMNAEGVGVLKIRRVMNRLVYGHPDGPSMRPAKTREDVRTSEPCKFAGLTCRCGAAHPPPS